MGKLPKLYFIILITFLVLLILPSAYAGSKKEKSFAQKYRDEGYYAQRSGNLDMALGYYQRALEMDSNYALVYNDIGVILEAKNMLAQAEEAYLKSLALEPNCLSANYNLAALYERRGEYDKASYYWKMRVYLGDWSDVWTWKANEHFEKLDKTGAVSKRKVPFNSLGLKIGPNAGKQADYHLYRGKQYLLMGEYVLALKEFNAASLLDPDNEEIINLREDAQKKVLIEN